MADFRAIYDARFNQGGTDIAERIKAACAYVAQAIFMEDVGAANHAARLKWAKHVLISGNIDTMVQAMHWLVVANPKIAGDLSEKNPVSDSDIEYVIGVSAAIFGETL
jgi:serine/threonine-protein kinase RIO1